jgi:hypothetical protein
MATRPSNLIVMILVPEFGSLVMRAPVLDLIGDDLRIHQRKFACF